MTVSLLSAFVTSADNELFRLLCQQLWRNPHDFAHEQHLREGMYGGDSIATFVYVLYYVGLEKCRTERQKGQLSLPSSPLKIGPLFTP